ncbi:MAG: hypothetical protein RRY41_01625, partial [Burkholderiaceae bacterium]
SAVGPRRPPHFLITDRLKNDFSWLAPAATEIGADFLIDQRLLKVFCKLSKTSRNFMSGNFTFHARSDL